MVILNSALCKVERISSWGFFSIYPWHEVKMPLSLLTGSSRTIVRNTTGDARVFLFSRVKIIVNLVNLVDLVNLVRRSFNIILKEVKRPQDIDNTHVISLIERKMTQDDLKVWARHINLKKLEPSMSNLLLWMEDGMTARLRSGAAIRKTGASSRSSVHTVGSNGHVEEGEGSITDRPDDRKPKQNTCYVCKGDHYVDKCSRFLAMVPGERWKVVKEQRGCFSCLKRGKGHTSISCTRRKACGKKGPDGTAYRRPHHDLLHETEGSGSAHVGFIHDSSKAILPVITSAIQGRQGEIFFFFFFN